jgi:8-amino-7-oxononanoate synthase
MGSTGSRLISGNHPIAQQTEDIIAAFHQSEAALLFNSGYDANLGLFSALGHRNVVFVYDELCHASIIDGIRLGICRNKYAFRHNDVQHLQELMARHAKDNVQVFVAIETIYSMDGDIAPIAHIADVCGQFGAALIADEAHATGVWGTQGEGLVVSLGLQQQVFARIHTFGKALGGHGAVVVGSNVLHSFLVNFARSLVYSTALPPHSIAWAQQAYRHMASAQFSNTALHTAINYFCRQMQQAAIPGWQPTPTPIQIVVTPGNDNTRHVAAQVRAAGLLVHPILHPTVPLGAERLRICLHAHNTHTQIDLLINTLQHAIKS